MGNRWFVSLTAVAASLLLAIGFLLTAGSSAAQDASGTPAAMGAAEAHPAHIHSGTCASLGEVVYPLEDVTAVDATGTPVAVMAATPTIVPGLVTEEMMGDVVAQSSTTVEASLESLLTEQFAINVHESAENIQNYIACGDIIGVPRDNQLGIELNELNDSGFEGRAILIDNGDETTTVLLFLMRSDDGEATPMASPAS